LEIVHNAPQAKPADTLLFPDVASSKSGMNLWLKSLQLSGNSLVRC
jgi:hypothetical protein